ncbi:TrmH family RNA methyltransferase [Deinococcus yavapaiensis]|uniref:TrmH family RNA methyltransferase n=1 Tax=Deinococcus yavapaiensis KR-236 TaxID=694435 RepID=A0A318SPH4_9DEIO|nr:RNA methyltransferase [Deinococcus yavapaiensis]PYE54733.1 TrmH family RNA methyltransferase [Deinococcus yavapaiensis KR-236]
MRELTSPQNPEIKAVARLKERRDREREGRFLVEGTRELQRAVRGGVALETVYVCEALLRPEGREFAATLSVPTVRVSPDAFAKLSVRENPDGLIGVAPARATSTPSLPRDALVLVLVGLEKPGNLGALLRTADGVGVDLVLLAGRGVDLHNPNVIRASQGSVFTVPTAVMTDDEALAFLGAQSVRAFALTPEADDVYWRADLTGRAALVLGTEHEGLPPRWKAAATRGLSIPMRGEADSLNVATAGALVLYEALRQRSTRS